MEFDFLKPVDDYILALNQLLPKQSLGRSIKIHTLQLGLPSLEGVRLVLFGVSEFRGGTVKSKDKEVLQVLEKSSINCIPVIGMRKLPIWEILFLENLWKTPITP